MDKKGIILIVEDHFQEKIGSFYDQLIKNEYGIKIAENLEEADTLLNQLLDSNEIDGMILDFAFPVNDSDLSTTIDGIPNGVALLSKHLFKLNVKRVPVIINTTADELYKKKHLHLLDLSMPVYNVKHEMTPLAGGSAETFRDILTLFNNRNSERFIKPDRKWANNGSAFIKNEKGEIIGYRY